MAPGDVTVAQPLCSRGLSWAAAQARDLSLPTPRPHTENDPALLSRPGGSARA